MSESIDPSRADRIAEALGADGHAPVEEVLGVSPESLASPLGILAAAQAFDRRQANLREQAAAQSPLGTIEGEVVDDKKE